MRLNWNRIFAVLLMVVFVGCGEDEPEKVKPKQVEMVDEGPKRRIVWEKDGVKMTLIPAGSFEMGDQKGEDDVLPVHTVELDAFYMDIHEVTVAQFKRFVEESGYAYEGDWNSVAKYSPTDECPMVYVSWPDATAYCEWAGKRLPTEAEWEYAARGGLKGKQYPWGSGVGVNGKRARTYANYRGTAVVVGALEIPKGKDKWDESTAPVGSFKPNGYGLYDVAGNAWEWCADWYGADYYSNSPLRNPQGPSAGEWRILRGGGWLDFTDFLRVGYRFPNPPENGNDSSFGFRCVSGLAAVPQ